MAKVPVILSGSNSTDLLNLMLDNTKCETRKAGIKKFHENFEHLMVVAKGSDSKHQAWLGGYLDHIYECVLIATKIYECEKRWPIKLSSALIVLYFHDIEKLWKYTSGEVIDKEKWFFEILPNEYGITFNEEERNALKYIHGEGDDYCDERVMNELAGFCHAVDTLSARTLHFWNRPDIFELEVPCEAEGLITDRFYKDNMLKLTLDNGIQIKVSNIENIGLVARWEDHRKKLPIRARPIHATTMGVEEILEIVQECYGHNDLEEAAEQD